MLDRWTRPGRRLRPALACLAGAALAASLTSCATPESNLPAAPPASAPTALPPAPPATVGPLAPVSPQPSAATAAAGPASGAGLAGHIHNLSYAGERLLLGTHAGLWAQDPGREPGQVSAEPFDVMGFTQAGERWLASGHPGPRMDAPADLGLLQSTDAGRTWQEVSLGGEVDFHRLVASGMVVVGVNAHDGRMLRSADGGQVWADLGTPGLYDVVIDPADSSVLVGSTPDGPVRSTDGGVSFAPVVDAPLLALLAWSPGGLYGVGVTGEVFASADGGVTWQRRGVMPGEPAALAAAGSRLAVLVGDRVLESTDGGMSFADRIVGIPGH